MLSKVASKSSLQSRSGILIRQFSHDVLKIQQSKMQYHTTAGVGDSLSRWCFCGGSTRQFRWVSNPVAVMAPTGGFVRSITSLTLKVGSSGVIYKGNFSSTLQPCTHKRFSTNADMLENQDLDIPENQDLDMPRSYEIGMPPLCLTRNEVNIVKWVKKVGDRIYPGDVICEVETDRGVVEFETIEDGYLAKIIKGDGTQGIKPGEVIGLAVEEEADIEKLKNNELFESESDVPESNEPSEPEASERSEAPALASDTQNISKPNVDIEDYSASRGKEAQTTAAKDAEGVGLDFTDIPHTQIGKVTAARLLMSKQTIPHYYLTVDTCVDKLMELRSQLNSLQEASGGKRISVNDLVIKAAALALKKVPACNSSWTNDYIRQYHNVNINVAVQTDNGLYVPVVRDADKKSLSKISEEVGTLAQKARENSLKPEECEGGTFTMSNLGGPFGTKQFCAIINPPQAAILAIGTAEKRVVPGIGADPYKLSSFMSVALSCDHCVIDGAIGAEWLKAFKGYIENPESMML